MIKKFYFALALGAVTSLIACDSKSASTDNADETKEQTTKTEEVAKDAPESEPATQQSEEQVISELMEMYSNTMDMKQSFMTSDLLDYVGSAEMTAFKKGDEMGWIDYNMWTFSQDSDMSAKEVKNVTFTSDSTATADVVGGGFGPNGFVTVTVLLVDGHYRVDDIVGGDMGSIKNQAKKYLGRD